MSDINIIGVRLRLLREENGLSQSEFAEKMSVNRMTINNYEKGKRTPDIAFAAAAAKYYGVTLEYLTGKSQFRNRDDMLTSVQKSERLLGVVENMPQEESQLLLVKLADLMESANENNASEPLLIALISIISELDRLLSAYAELNENIVRSVAELRWQKIQSTLIQWTCLEKTKALSEITFSAADGIFDAFRLCEKMFSKKLADTLENESEK